MAWPVHPKVWVTRIEAREGLNMALVEQVCRDIARRDGTFRYEVSADGRNIYIYSASRDQAHRRGMWLRSRVSPEILYRVYYVRRRG